MELIVKKDYEVMSEKAANFVVDYVKKNSTALLCFPSGTTPLGMIQKLVIYAKEGKVDFSNCKFVGLDEWLGMTVSDEGSCKHFLYNNFFYPLQIEESRVCFFDACSSQLNMECKRIDQYIKSNGGIGLIVVGLGMNGHIGLNEPGTSVDLHSHVIRLDTVTKEVAQKYFKKTTSLKGGITLGLKHLQEAETVLLLVNGSHKANILKKLMDSDSTNTLPATIIKKHNNSFLIADVQAASLIG